MACACCLASAASVLVPQALEAQRRERVSTLELAVPRLAPPASSPIVFARPPFEPPDEALVPDDVGPRLRAWREATAALRTAVREHAERARLDRLDETVTAATEALAQTLAAHDDLGREGWALRGEIERAREDTREMRALEALEACLASPGPRSAPCPEPPREHAASIAAWEHVTGGDAIAQDARLQIAWALADEGHSERALVVARETLAWPSLEPVVEVHLLRLAASSEDLEVVSPARAAEREDRILADLRRASTLGVPLVSAATALLGADRAVRLGRWPLAIELGLRAHLEPSFVASSEAIVGYAVARLREGARRTLSPLDPETQALARTLGARRLREEARPDLACALEDPSEVARDCSPPSLEVQLAWRVADCAAPWGDAPLGAVLEVDRRGRVRASSRPSMTRATRQCLERARPALTPTPTSPLRARLRSPAPP
ncbi:MAG: hypothetical protein U0353_02290 [Sandaracinus sp.]